MKLVKYFKGKKIIVTGHTGFKGSWLVSWLKILQANVLGIGLEPITNPSHFDVLGLKNKVDNNYLDIRDNKSVKELIMTYQPDFVFHLAAQSLVKKSFKDPLETWTTNLVGTVNILDGLRFLRKNCVAVIITSDKCYDNVEWTWGYRENDRLGGDDPYSASKGSAELAIKSYIKSFFSSNTSNVRIGSARAGNVIGGGDWAENRLVPDCIKAWSSGKSVNIRNPNATRPWQHVLEPLSGYLTQAMAMKDSISLHGESFNFGPSSDQNESVKNLVDEMSNSWEQVKWNNVSKDNDGPHESELLKLNCDKALHSLNWKANLSFLETVKMTIDWYKSFYNKSSFDENITYNQIEKFMKKANENKIEWAS